MRTAEKLIIIGIDGLEPSLALERWSADLPNIRGLARRGLSGRVTSTTPPLNPASWSCLTSGKDPGALGIYGVRCRRDWSYEELDAPTNLDIRQPRLWNHLSRAGKETLLVGVPQTFPVLRAPLGAVVACSAAPSVEAPYTYPEELAEEVAKLVGEYRLDVELAAAHSADEICSQAGEITRQRFAVARHLMRTRSWDVSCVVDIGLDRLGRHIGVPADVAPAADDVTLHDHYVLIDEQIGEMLEGVDLERTAVMVVSVYGARHVTRRFCVNQWLLEQGFLKLRSTPARPQPLMLADVDWQHTQAWCEGGYHGQLFVNMAGREPRGQIPADHLDGFVEELCARLMEIPSPESGEGAHRADTPSRLYEAANGVPPDLLLQMDGLRWYCDGRVGQEGWLLESDREVAASGPGSDGVLVLACPGVRPGRRETSLYDVLPTVLELLGVPVPRWVAWSVVAERCTGGINGVGQGGMVSR